MTRLVRAISQRNCPSRGWHPAARGFHAAGTALFLWLFVRALVAADWQEGSGFRFQELSLPAAGRTYLQRLPLTETGIRDGANAIIFPGK